MTRPSTTKRSTKRGQGRTATPARDDVVAKTAGRPGEPSPTPRSTTAPARAPAGTETRNRIVEAALVEFAEHGYEAASTNTIAASAGVAKGLVFHHFGAKDRLYLEVHAHVLSRMDAALLGGELDLPSDLFERLHTLAMRKLALFRDAPALMGFAKTLTGALPDAVRACVNTRHHAAAAQGWARLVEGLDATSLGEGVTIEAAVETLSVLGDGLERRMMAMLAAGHTPEDIAAFAWQHYDRVRRGLGRPMAGDANLEGPAAAITPRATRARGRARPRA